MGMFLLKLILLIFVFGLVCYGVIFNESCWILINFLNSVGNVGFHCLEENVVSFNWMNMWICLGHFRDPNVYLHITFFMCYGVCA